MENPRRHRRAEKENQILLFSPQPPTRRDFHREAEDKPACRQPRFLRFPRVNYFFLFFSVLRCALLHLTILSSLDLPYPNLSYPPLGCHLVDMWLSLGCHPTKRSVERGRMDRQKLEYTMRCAKRRMVFFRLGRFQSRRRMGRSYAQKPVERTSMTSLRRRKTDANRSGTVCRLRFFWSKRPEMKEKQKSLHFPLWRKPRKMENRRMDSLPSVHFRV